MNGGTPSTPESLVEHQLDELLLKLEDILGADVLTFVGPLIYTTDDHVRDEIEAITPKRPKLAVVLETDGGYIDVVERVANTFRHHYGHVEFIVPNFAMSAGTVLVMSGDAIYMDYYSTLGPIDPQVQRPGSEAMVPALGYLEQYDRLVEKSARGAITSAEVAYMVERFDPAELYAYEQARELSISLLKQWLVRYKFKDWKRTETRKRRVTNLMKERRAADVAKKLNDTKRWHSHSRGISMAVARRDLKLLIEDLDVSPDLASSIRAYHKLLSGYMVRVGHMGILHRRGKYLIWARRAGDARD